MDGEEEWEEEDIVEYKDVGEERRFLFKWAGWPAEYHTWEPQEHLSNPSGVLMRYWLVGGACGLSHPGPSATGLRTVFRTALSAENTSTYYGQRLTRIMTHIETLRKTTST